MRALKLPATVDEDHQLSMSLPEDVPAGPAEVIVLFPSGRAVAGGPSTLLEAVRELRSTQRTVEEDRVLSDFEAFRQAHPFQLSSLREP